MLTIVGNFRLLGLLTERSVVLVYYCRVMAIVELWKILKLLFAKVFFEIIFAENDVIYHNFEFKCWSCCCIAVLAFHR